METQAPASASPTPEALLGMLGKLKRTLTRDLSEQRRTSNDKGYISAAVLGNPDRNDAPNLLRPSSGLDFLAEKTALPEGAAERPRSPVAAALELESAAPPMDLDRSSRLGSSPVPHLPLPNLSTYTVPPVESSESAQDTSSLEDSREKDGSVKLAASPADASPDKVANLTDQDRPSKPVSTAEDATDVNDDPERGREASSITPSEVLAWQGTRDESESSAKTDTVTESEAAGADTTSSGPLQGPQDQQPVAGQQEMQADAEGQLSGSAPIPVTEEGLDNAMQELALEVSQLQPSTSPLVSQGSYLQRHTSSLILKMSQDAVTPPLPAVAHIGAAARSEASSPQVAISGRVAKPSDPQKTIRSMAASLFRAFDEGRLKERAPAPAATSGAPAQAEHTLAATLRTYRSSPPTRREASTAPPARTSSYASRQQASLRRSLSPHARPQTSAASKRPEWDASKPSQPSPERTKRAADALNQAIAAGICLHSQPSPQRAQPAVAESPIQNDGHLRAQHAAASPKLPGKGQVSPTPSPPRFRRLPSSSILDRPAWASPTQPRATGAAVPSQASSLKRSAGSRTVTASDERRQTATGSHHTEGGVSGNSTAGTHAALQAAITPPRTANPPANLPALPPSDKARQRNNLHAALGQASNLVKRPSEKRSQAGGSRKRSWQPTSAAPHASKGIPEPEVPIVEGRQAQLANQGWPVHRMASSLQSRQRASALEAFGIAPSPLHTNAVLSHRVMRQGFMSTPGWQLPVSHRLPVSRSVFDSDEGSLVSSDEEVIIRNKGTASANPQGSQAQPLTEEATLALLPDRGMSPVSESSGDQAASGSGQRRERESARPAGPPDPQRAQHMRRSNTDTRDEVYPWRALAWAHGPSWFRVICKLLPSPQPHFTQPLGPHLLQTSLGLHGADAKNYAFDQVLLEDCSEADVAEQVSGVIQAVLQGRNSVVLALGQAGSGKSHTMLGGALDDEDVSSSTGVSTTLVESLFLEIQQRRLPAEVQSVYVTAFQIMNETIQDLLQIREAEADAKQSHKRGGSASDRHDVFVDKQQRTWVSNLAAFQISSPADFANMLGLISSRRHQSSSSHPHINGAAGSRGMGRGKVQDSTMRSVSEVVWAAAHGKGVPVPNRACKLTRYLQDTLCPSGRAVGIMCVDPAISAQAVGMPTLAASERMMPLQD
ncbi:hypothetical protein WJX79_008659 [Trebouxia sp. C0005]